MFQTCACAQSANRQLEELGGMIRGPLGIDDLAEDQMLHGLAVGHDRDGRQDGGERGNSGTTYHSHLRDRKAQMNTNTGTTLLIVRERTQILQKWQGIAPYQMKHRQQFTSTSLHSIPMASGTVRNIHTAMTGASPRKEGSTRTGQRISHPVQWLSVRADQMLHNSVGVHKVRAHPGRVELGSIVVQEHQANNIVAYMSLLVYLERCTTALAQPQNEHTCIYILTVVQYITLLGNTHTHLKQ